MKSRLFLMNTIYSKLVLFFISILLVLVIILSYAFSYIFTSAIMSELQKQDLEHVNKLRDEFDSHIIRLESMYLLMVQNADIRIFLEADHLEPEYTVRANNFIRQLRQLDTMIYSIYLKNKKMDIMLSAGPDKIDPDQFQDEGFKRLSVEGNRVLYFSRVGRTEDELKKGQRTLSFLFPLEYGENAQRKYPFVFSLDRSAVEEILQVNPSQEGSRFICDKNGTVVFSTGRFNDLVGINRKEVFTRIKGYTDTSGYFQMQINQIPTVVSYTISPKTGLYFVSINSASVFLNIINEKRNKIVIVSIIAFILISLFSFLLLRRIYQPIKRITNVLAGSKFSSKVVDYQNEAQIISEVYNKAHEYIENMETLGAKVRHSVKEEFVRKLLSDYFEYDMETKADEMGFEIDFTNCIIVCIRLDSYYSVSDRQRMVYEATLIKIIPDILNEAFRCDIVSMFNGEIALMLTFRSEEENSFSLLHDSLVQVIQASEKTLGISLTIGLGKYCTGISECRDAYQKAQEMTRFRFVLGTGRVIYEKMVEDRCSKQMNHPRELEDKLISAIIQNDRESFIENLENLIQHLTNYSYSDAIYMFLQLLLICVKTASQVISKEMLQFRIKFDELNNLFLGLYTIEQAKQLLIGVFDLYQTQLIEINRLKGTKQYTEIEDAKCYIKEFYKNSSLTVEEIANHVGYTPYYFSKLFKSITKISINDYLMQVRINEAKRLLSESNFSVSEIASNIGFVSNNYFFSSFKKLVGLTPSAFRMLNKSDLGRTEDSNKGDI